MELWRLIDLGLTDTANGIFGQWPVHWVADTNYLKYIYNFLIQFYL